MANLPLVSVITPTFNRRTLLIDQCIPSVQAQTYPSIEHIVMIDGPGDLAYLAASIQRRFSENRHAFRYPIHLVELQKNYGHWGNAAKRQAITYHAKGNLIAYLDDDDIYESPHIELLQNAINSVSRPGFVYSIARTNWGRGPELVGQPVPTFGNITNSALMHRRSLVNIANWRDEAPAHTETLPDGRTCEREANWHIKSHAPDWDVIKRWLSADVGYKFVKAVTVEMRPHLAHGIKDAWHQIEAK